MDKGRSTQKGREKLLTALADFEHLTPAQLARLLGLETRSIRKQLRGLAAAGLVITLPRLVVTQPAVYTLTGKGYTALAAQGSEYTRRVRPSEEHDKAHNPYFMQHTTAVTDVLIAAKLLAQTMPGIKLTRLFLERELKRTIYIRLLAETRDGTICQRTYCLEPDASLEFLLPGRNETYQEFFHIEVYRTNLQEHRFKHKVACYAAYIRSTLHEELFQTPALAIAVLATTENLTATLKQWTEEALAHGNDTDLGAWFYFRSFVPGTESPEELFLASVWEQPFGNAKTPLLILEQEKNEPQTNHY